MNIKKIYKDFQDSFAKNISILDKKIYVILLGEILLKEAENKFTIIPVLSEINNLEGLKFLINKCIEDIGKSVKTKCILTFDIKENEIISSLEILGEIAEQEKIIITINKIPTEERSYQIF